MPLTLRLQESINFGNKKLPKLRTIGSQVNLLL